MLKGLADRGVLHTDRPDTPGTDLTVTVSPRSCMLWMDTILDTVAPVAG